MTKPIRGKVASVINEREIAINVGTTHGVTVGMYFDVMDAHDEDIRDPDTNEVLGSIKRPKVRVKITYAQERLSVASTYRSKRVNLGGSGGGIVAALDLGPFSKSLMPPNWVTKYETLKKRDRTTEGLNELNEEDSLVQTSDPVVQVLETDEADNGK